MKKYDKYKDSGIEWLGEIPEHWSPIAMKYYFYMKGRIGWQGLKADEFKSAGPYLVTGSDFENGKVVWERCYHITEERYNEAPEIHVKQGDLLITKDGTIGKLAYIDEKPDKVSLNSHLLILRPNTDQIMNKFVYWALQADNFIYYTGLSQNGSIMASLSQEKIGNYTFALPTVNEQAIIASYLDDKVSKIDAAIAEKESMIEDLQNYRKSVITKAVTHGLNPDVPMKDSGVDKFNEIPTHWEESKLKYIASINSGTSLSSEKLTKEGMYEVYGGNGCIGLTSEYNTKAPAIIIGRVGALCGNVHLIDSPKWVTDNALVLTLKKNFSYKFISYFLKAYDLNTLNSSNAQPLITGSKVLDVVIPLPKCKEQEEIVKYLDTKISNIEFCISKTKSQIEDLKAYKSSVITEAVTGKIDLR